MKTIENGNNVKLHYKGTFPDGEVFDDSRMRGDGLEVLVGEGKLLKAFESALVGMTEGETKKFSVKSDEAYGPLREEAIVTAPRGAFPEDFEFNTGAMVQGRGPQGQAVLAKIVSYDDNTVTLDHNHPLAGKDLNFEVDVIQINKFADTSSFTEEFLTSQTVKELRTLAKQNGIKGFSTMKKAKLVESLCN
tara:strand:- start:385 stop:957 length:573 start_codon:yes stop_codon:yes gene_type:complete